MIGRDEDLGLLADAVSTRGSSPSPGRGESARARLAVEYAQMTNFDSWFVDLGRVSKPQDVARAVLDVFGVSPRAAVGDDDRVVEMLQPRSCFLVLDNCEHLIDTSAELAQRICAETAGVRLLATSRQPLNVAAERVLIVEPLRLPDPSASREEQRRATAVQMFVERAERGGAVVDDIEDVIAICSRLDGIPLALELAAARMRAFSAQQILEQLDAGWSVSGTGRTGRTPHHSSLDDAIDWSFRLLGDGERALLLQLTTLRGPFDLAAAAAVAGADAGVTADQLIQLVDKSLIQSAPGRGGRRFRLLETVRAFASARSIRSRLPPPRSARRVLRG